jgi:hypothetical protein
MLRASMFGGAAHLKIVESRSAGAVLVLCRFASKLFVGNGAAYIEVVTDAYEAPPLYKKLHENVKSF